MISTPASSQPTTPSLETQDTRAEQALTLETLLWLLLGVVALTVRVFDLGRWPLSEREAALALEAWRFVQGEPYSLEVPPSGAWNVSPLAFNLQALFFALFGAGDVAARIGQAFGGALLVVAPWLLRSQLGRGHALAVSLLLLLSPTVLFFSRQASGATWAALAALLVLAGVVRWQTWGEERDALLAAVALGLGLASGAGFWSFLVAGSLFILWRRRRVGEFPWRLPEHFAATRYMIVTVATFIIASTAFLTNLQGFGAALNLPILWIDALVGSGASLAVPFLVVLVLYEGLTLVAALVAGTLMPGERSRWMSFALLWAVVTLLPALFSNPGWTEGLLMVVVPLALMGGAAVARLGEWLVEEGDWRVDGLLTLLAITLLIYFWIALVRYLATPEPARLAVVAAPLFLLGVSVYSIRSLYGPHAAIRALGLTAALWIAIASTSIAWGLSLTRGADPREPLVVEPSSMDLRVMATRLASLSIERYQDAEALPLAIEHSLGSAPIWYLRNFDTVTIVEGSHPDLPDAALLAPDAPPLPGRVGKRVWLGPSWSGVPADLPGLLRWLATREDGAGIIDRSAVLSVVLQSEE